MKRSRIYLVKCWRSYLSPNLLIPAIRSVETRDQYWSAIYDFWLNFYLDLRVKNWLLIFNWLWYFHENWNLLFYFHTLALPCMHNIGHQHFLNNLHWLLNQHLMEDIYFLYNNNLLLFNFLHLHILLNRKLLNFFLDF